MIEIIQSLFGLMSQFINGIFNFKIELVEGEPIEIGIVVVSFIFIVVALYLILKAVGIVGGDN